MNLVLTSDLNQTLVLELGLKSITS